MARRSDIRNTYKVGILCVIRTMAEQTSGANFKGIDVELTTEGPEAQNGHEIGSDVLHNRLVTAMEEVFERHD